MSDASYDPLTAAYYGEFVAYAVEMYRDDPSNLMPTPPSDFKSLGYQIIAYINAVDIFFDDSVKVCFGFIAQSQADPRQFVAAIRGTEATLEWLIDFEIWPTQFTAIPDADLWVEHGFFSVFETMTYVDLQGRPLSLADLLDTIAGSGNRLTIAGHSLGGALATMLALEANELNPKVGLNMAVYTLASPAVGDEAFANYFDARVRNSFRVWNEYDIVPRAFWFYTHVSGAGNEIVQTDQQYDEIAFSPPCEHGLTTYLWLLNPDNPFKDQFYASCQATNDDARAGRRALRPQLQARR